MNLDGKFSERYRIGSYKYVCDRTVIEMFKIILGSLQSEKETTWECYWGTSMFMFLEKRQEAITEDWEAMTGMVGREPRNRRGMKIKVEVKIVFPVRSMNKGSAGERPTSCCLVCLQLSHHHWSCLICSHRGLVSLDSPWLGNSKIKARDFNRTNSMLPFKTILFLISEKLIATSILKHHFLSK